MPRNSWFEPLQRTVGSRSLIPNCNQSSESKTWPKTSASTKATWFEIGLPCVSNHVLGGWLQSFWVKCWPVVENDVNDNHFSPGNATNKKLARVDTTVCMCKQASLSSLRFHQDAMPMALQPKDPTSPPRSYTFGSPLRNQSVPSGPPEAFQAHWDRPHSPPPHSWKHDQALGTSTSQLGSR